MKAKFTINLAPLDLKDKETIREWRNDYRIWKWCRQNDLISDQMQDRWFTKQDQDQTIKMYRIECGLDGETHIVGVCGFTGIDLINRHAEFSLYIGPKFHGRGYGKEALTILLRHGFMHYGFNHIYGETFYGNNALRTFAEVGMTLDGKRRGFYFREGKFIDAFLVSITREEWDNRYAKPDSVGDSDAKPNSDGDSNLDREAAIPKLKPVQKRSGAIKAPPDILTINRIPEAQAKGDDRGEGVPDGARGKTKR